MEEIGHPTIYPTGVTIYDREAAWNGYTVLPSAKGVVLIDMNGHEVRVWRGLKGNPPKILPGGYVIASTGERTTVNHTFDNLDLVQVDWNGNIAWKFDRFEHITDLGKPPRWIARQNHDYQREGSATGYYSPGAEPRADGGNTLMVVCRNVVNPIISDKVLLDSSIIEVTWEGEIVWQWNANEHFDEMGFDEAAKNVIHRQPSSDVAHGGQGYWLAINNINRLGPNKWYDAGDERFHPDNIVWDGRNANVMAIISKKTGKIVWRVGPDFDRTGGGLGQIIGQHHLHMIQKGLPGEGNFLVYDNGGWAGYGAPNPVSKYGTANQRRDYSRILEFDPITLEIVWQYTPREAGHIHPLDSYKFYTSFVSSAQRLLNGNTLITEGRDGRLFEVTPEHKTVWEYVSPYFRTITRGRDGVLVNNMTYRAYRVPYEWIPQLAPPKETSIEAANVSTLRVPGAPPGPGGKVTKVEGIAGSGEKIVEDPFRGISPSGAAELSNFCVIDSGE
ncbi:MAG: aryl-sulfate sulfotransferase [Synergistaceae bacterium]|nr:aryl-sulfate sulfotransferase [Synergistaceae bacterium]